MTLHKVTWADAGAALVRSLGRKWTYPRELFFYTWFQGENTKAHYNPCATTMPEPGATDFNSAGVKNYVSWSQGITAWHSTIILGYYVQLRAALATKNASTMCLALAASPWGTYHRQPNQALAVLHTIAADPNIYGAKLIGQP